MRKRKTGTDALRLRNPVLLASGTCGYGVELSDLADLSLLGGIVVKGISLEPREGNPPPRIVETACGLLNSIGLENPGVEYFIEHRLPLLKTLDTAIVVNILGNSPEEYGRLAALLNLPGYIDAIEVNISCPNVKAGGIAFGALPESAAEVTRAVKKETDLPVIVKLSPNVTDITSIALAVEKAGADAVSLINTLLGMAIDIDKRRPVLANIFGGLSGPAIKPIALRMVWQVAEVVEIPVIGIGGISTWRDAVEFFMAGASAVQIGTATLATPDAAIQIVNGLERFMEEQGIKGIEELHIQRT